VLREGESAIVAASGFGSPTEPLGSPSTPSSRPRRPCFIGSEPISGLPDEITSDQIRPHIAARRKMQLAGCMIQKPTRLWARGCGGPELYGKVISRQTNDNSTTIGLTPAAGIVEGRLEANGLSSRTIAELWLFCCLVVFTSRRYQQRCYLVGPTCCNNGILCSTWWQFCYCRIVCRSPPRKASKASNSLSAPQDMTSLESFPHFRYQSLLA
jgi:hypothetical protein